MSEPRKFVDPRSNRVKSAGKGDKSRVDPKKYWEDAYWKKENDSN